MKNKEQFRFTKQGQSFLKQVFHTQTIRMEDVIDSIDYEDGIKFVKCLDQSQEDWGFTENLFRYFSEELLKLDLDNEDEELSKETKVLIEKLNKKFNK